MKESLLCDLLAVPYFPQGGGGGGGVVGGAMVLGKLPVPRRPTIWVQ